MTYQEQEIEPPANIAACLDAADALLARWLMDAWERGELRGSFTEVCVDVDPEPAKQE